MVRTSSPGKHTTERVRIISSPPPVISPLNPIPPLDMREYDASPSSISDRTPRQRFPLDSIDFRPSAADHVPQPPIERSQSNLVEVASYDVSNDVGIQPVRSRQSYRASASRTSLLASAPPNGSTRDPSPVPTTPYLSHFATTTDNFITPAEEPPIPTPTSPTAEALAELGAPTGHGPRHFKKLKYRIAIWAEEVAEVNETQPTKPLPKPRSEWERLGRRVLKRREENEWPGPKEEDDEIDKTGMYAGQRMELHVDEYFGPHPGLNRGDGQSMDRGTSPRPPTPHPDDTPSYPTRNILIDNGDGAADSLSPSISSNEADQKKKAKIATNERLNRAARLLAKQTQAAGDETKESSEQEVATPEMQKKRHIDIMEWRKSLGKKTV